MNSIPIKNQFIYLGVAFFILLSIMPWITNKELSFKIIHFYSMYFGVVNTFIGGSFWWNSGLKDSNYNHLTAITASLIACSAIFISLSSVTLSILVNLMLLNLLLLYENNFLRDKVKFLEYIDTRKMATYLVTLTAILQIAFLFNPYLINFS